MIEEATAGRTPSADRFRDMLRSGACLSGLHLRDVDLAGSAGYDLRLAECVFRGVSFAGTDWPGLRAQRCRFIDCRFANANLVDGVFAHCRFFDAESGQGGDFSGARLGSATFERCDLSRSRFVGADLFNVAMVGINGVGIEMRGARFRGAGRITGCALAYADLREALLARCELTENDLRHALLDHADLREASLVGSDLNGVTLRGTQLAGADLRGAILGSAFDLRTVDLTGVLINEGQMRSLLDHCDLVICPDGEPVGDRDGVL
jgi:fluoroquinolone resistance protein